MSDFQDYTVTVLATIEIHATIEAESPEEAKRLALDIEVDEHGYGDGVTVSTSDGLIDHVAAFGIERVIDVEEA